MSDAERKAVISVLRSLATSRRDASLVDLIRDYGETEGGQIPYKKFGYGRLEDLLIGSGQFSLTPYGTVRVHCSEESSHIQRLVAEQKNTNTKKKRQPQQWVPPRPTSATGQRSMPMQPSLYSRAIQQLKVRSPIKTNTNRSQSAGSGNNNYYNHHQHHPAANNHQHPNINNNGSSNNHSQPQPNNANRSYRQYSHIPPMANQPSPPPLVTDKPSYVVTFQDGESVMRPANDLARQHSAESNQISSSIRQGSANNRAGDMSSPPSTSAKQQSTQLQQQQPRAITKNTTAAAANAASMHVQGNLNGSGGVGGYVDLRQRLNQKRDDATEPIPTDRVTQGVGGYVDLRQRLSQKRDDATEPMPTDRVTQGVGGYVDLRQRLSQKRDDATVITNLPAESVTQGLIHNTAASAASPQQMKAVDMLRQRHTPPRQGEPMQQIQPQQSQPQPQAQSVQPSVDSLQSSLSARLQNRLKISSQPEPLTVTVPSPVQYTNISSTQNSSMTSPANDGATVARSTLNNRLFRKVSVENIASSTPSQLQAFEQNIAQHLHVPPPQLRQNDHNHYCPPAFTPQQAPPNPADNITTLAIYCTNKNFAVPSYKIFKMQKTNRLQCRLMINGVTYSSYPHDFESVREAKLYTAGEALQRLRELDVEEQYPLCMDLDSELVLKLFDSLKESPHGMFERNIPEHFQKIYRQSLPQHWPALIVMSEHAQLFSVAESVQGNKIIHALSASDLQNRPMSTNKPSSSNQIQPTPPPKQCLRATSTPSATNYEHMERLVLPWADKYWNLFITNPKSTVDVWARLIGPDYSDQMDNLIVDIELDLMQSRDQPSTLMVGHIYLVVVSECTYRVRIDRNDFARKRCLCFYVDVGDEEWVAMDEIYVCKPQFLLFPAQAICLSLFGLEDCAENPIAPPHLVETLMNKTLIGDVASQREDYEAQERSSDEAPKVVVALYDTSSEEDVQLNSLILDRICAHSQPPQLDPTGVTNVVISHVTDSGDVYCQPLTMTGGIHYVQKLIHHITRFGFNPDHHRVQDIVQDEAARLVLLVQDESDEKWYRATVLQRAAERCQVFYVDYGMTRTVSTTKMYRLDSMCQVLHSYPFQAIVCKLHEVPHLAGGQLASLRGYLRPGVQAMVKITGLRQKIPVVKIFIRQRDGPLFTVNDVIQFEQEIESSTEDVAASPTVIWNCADVMPKSVISSRPPSANGLHATQALQPLAKCPTPAIGDRFEVHVTMASNPHNFKVRPHRQVPHFQSLMVELQEHCKRTTDYVPDDQVCIDQAYACQQPDNVWYRVVVQNLISNSMFLICYCDYGDIVVVNSDRLKVLPAAFRQLPALAISARLSGVKPLNRDWETDDCLRFQRMTVDKKFVSRIDNILRAGAPSDEVILALTLIDVSTATDVNINQLLVMESRAVLAPDV